MKKISNMIIIIMLVGTMFTGCGRNEVAEETNKLIKQNVIEQVTIEESYIYEDIIYEDIIYEDIITWDEVTKTWN